MAEFVTGETLDWGRCKVKIYAGETAGVSETPTTLINIVEGSTQLNTTQGDKTEAKVEGGEVIATRYQRNKYTLQFQEYGQPSIDHLDGVVTGKHLVELINCDGDEDFNILSIVAIINVQPGWTSQNGTVTQYTCDAVRQDEGSITWGTIPTDDDGD